MGPRFIVVVQEVKKKKKKRGGYFAEQHSLIHSFPEFILFIHAIADAV